MTRYRKYNNKKVKIDGHTFDSIGESRRYQELKLLEGAGEISDLKLQPKFELQPTFRKNGKTHRAITYTTDFQYIENGKVIVEDFKGVRTQVFRIKQKMFEHKFDDLELRIVN